VSDQGLLALRADEDRFTKFAWLVAVHCGLQPLALRQLTFELITRNRLCSIGRLQVEAAIDTSVRLRLEAVIEEQQATGVRLTPQAITLLTVMIESIDDDTNGRVRLTGQTLAAVQMNAVEKIPVLLQSVKRTYPNIDRMNALMLLVRMPRLMSGFCPPFENPPD
jgi:hypothetical protein